MPSASARPSAKSARRSSNSNLAKASCGAAAVHDLAGPGAGERAFEARRDRILPGARFAQLTLELGDIGFIAAEHVSIWPISARQALGHVGRLLPFDQRGLGEVLAVLRQRQLGLFGPIVLELVEPVDRAAHLLDVGDRAGGHGADFDQRFFHLQDDHPDHPRRVLGPVEKLGHVRGENVAGTAEHRAIEPIRDRGEPRGRRLGLLGEHRGADRNLALR